MLELNKIYNMDCLVGMKQIDSESIDLVLTDPPYNINFKPQRNTFEGILNDNLNDTDFDDLLNNYFKECFRVLKNDTILITFMGWSTIPQFNKAITAAGFEIKSMPIWIKNNFGIGYYTRPQYEPMYLCLKGKPKPPENAISDVLKFDKVYDLIHSCQKPLNLINKLIKTFSKKGDLVFDGFMGSGTTAIACIDTKRNYLGFELDTDCFSITTKRIETRINTPTFFDELIEEYPKEQISLLDELQ